MNPSLVSLDNTPKRVDVKSAALVISAAIFLFCTAVEAGDIPEFGKKSDSTIKVTVTDPGFRTPGIYYVTKEANFGSLIEQAQWLRICSGKFTISRIDSGKTENIELGLKDHDFKLHDGDIIHAETMTTGNPHR